MASNCVSSEISNAKRKVGINKIKKGKAVFLDRDGTIIKQVDFLTSSSQLVILPGVIKALKNIKKLGYLIIIITNQPIVARGLLKIEALKKINYKLMQKLKNKGASVDEIYFCPHHPEATLKKYRKKCNCRKPKPGMILKAAKKYNIDLNKSFIIGDALIDIVAGHRANVKSILIKTGPGHLRLDNIYKNEKPNFKAKNLLEAVKIICPN